MLFPLWIFIPDFIPVLGYLDDVILFPALVSLTVKFIPEDVLKKNRRNAEGIWSGWNAWKWILYDSSCGSVGDYNWGIGVVK